MTGEKIRIKTYEQLWKIDDSELSTPRHDELVLHLLYDKNAEKLVRIANDFTDGYLIDNIKVTSEYPICASNDFIIGYADIIIRYGNNYFVCVEVKPKIKSFGETLRQINTYKKYRSSNFVIYSPDTTFKAAFETQGIKIITPSDLGLK
jgi:hypothetical protein